MKTYEICDEFDPYIYEAMHSNIYYVLYYSVLRKFRKDNERTLVSGVLDWAADKKCLWLERWILESTLNKRISNRALLLSEDLINEFDEFVKRHYQRMKFLFAMVFNKYAPSRKLFEPFTTFYEFCRQHNRFDLLDDTVDKAFQYFSSREEMWLIVAQHYVVFRNDISNGRKLLKQASALFESNNLIWKSLVDLELRIYNDSRNQTQNNANINNNTVEVTAECLKNICAYISRILIVRSNEYQLFVDLLRMLEKHPFTRRIQIDVVAKLKTDFPENEDTWHVLAQNVKKNGGEDQLQYLQLYRFGLSTVRTYSSRRQLWCYYIDELVYLRQQDTTKTNDTIRMALRTACETASKDAYLEERHFLAWSRLGTMAEGLAIAEQGVAQYPKAVSLWKNRICRLLRMGVARRAYRTFTMAVAELQAEALPLWLVMLRSHVMFPTELNVERLYSEGVRQPAKVSDTLKDSYLQWLALEKGIEQVRLRYRQFATVGPFDRRLYSTMWTLECQQADVNLDALERMQHALCAKFGGSDVHVWLDYVRHYVAFRGSQPEVLDGVRKRAKRALPRDLYAIFAAEVSLITGAPC